MHSTIVRAQNVFGFFTTVAFVVAALIAASDFITPRTPRAEVAVNNVQVYVLPPSISLSPLPLLPLPNPSTPINFGSSC